MNRNRWCSKPNHRHHPPPPHPPKDIYALILGTSDCNWIIQVGPVRSDEPLKMAFSQVKAEEKVSDFKHEKDLTSHWL